MLSLEPPPRILDPRAAAARFPAQPGLLSINPARYHLPWELIPAKGITAARLMYYLLAIILPAAIGLAARSWALALVLLVLQLTVIGWPVASIAALIEARGLYRERRNRQRMREAIRRILEPAATRARLAGLLD